MPARTRLAEGPSIGGLFSTSNRIRSIVAAPGRSNRSVRQRQAGRRHRHEVRCGGVAREPEAVEDHAAVAHVHAAEALPLVQDLADALARDAQQLRELLL